MKVAVLGSGSWGTALALSLAHKGYEVRLWNRDEKNAKQMDAERENNKYLKGIKFPDNLFVTADMQRALHKASMVVTATPSSTIREVLTKHKDLFSGEQIIVNAAKGFENNSLMRMSEIVNEILPNNVFAAISGPSHAEELALKMPTTCVIASEDKIMSKWVQSIFNNEFFRIYTNSDLISVESAAALKNVIALAAGMGDGMGFGDNSKTALITRGILEIATIADALGGRALTCYGLTGIGDLIVTCNSKHSRNRRAGILLGQGMSMEELSGEINMVVEGINTASVANELRLKYKLDLPICEQIYKVIYEDKSVKKAVSELMSRELISEDIKIQNFLK